MHADGFDPFVSRSMNPAGVSVHAVGTVLFVCSMKIRA